MIHLKIDNINVEVADGATVIDAARKAGIYIPVLCSHPDLKPFRSVELSDYVYRGSQKIFSDSGAQIEHIKGCGVCLVYDESAGKPLPSCSTPAENGMNISTIDKTILSKRQENLMIALEYHPHSCLTCSQREGCIPLTDVCPGNVIFQERCCALLGNCEFQRIVDFVGVAPETLRFQHRNLPIVKENPILNFDYNLCIDCGRCVRVCQQVKGVYALAAVINNGKLTVGTREPLLKESECRFCGSCVEVCPTGAIMDKRAPRLKVFSDLVPCRSACPGEVDIPQYVRLVAEGKTQDAADVISSSLPLPSTLGKVCFHPCETYCKRNEVSEVLFHQPESLSIRMIKDYAMSHSTLKPSNKIKENTGKKVAVIGAGPAGLSTAHFLSLKGHSVTIYEKENLPGGMLRFGIPRYRLSDAVLDKDLNWLLSSGINFVPNTSFGSDITLDSLKNDGFDSVFLAFGLSKSRQLPIQNNNNGLLIQGIEFLNSLSKNLLLDDYFASKNIVVIGGGNVATDAARSAIRLKADKVIVVSLEQYHEMPAYPREIKEAEEEGITFKNGWGIAEINKISDINSKEIEQIKLRKCTAVFDSFGKFSPVFDDSVTECINAHYIIVCIGQEAYPDFLDDEKVKSQFVGGLIKVNKDTLETGIIGVYAGGDIVTGPASVIDAVGAGRKAARTIDISLGGDGKIEDSEKLNKNYNMFVGRMEGFISQRRVESDFAEPQQRKQNFSDVEMIFSDSKAISESSRCMQCDLRLHLSHNPYPPEKYLKFTIDNLNVVPELEGVIQLLDSNKEVTSIKGSDNMRKTLYEIFNDGKSSDYFLFEQDPMFTKRESELIQQFLQKHGKMPDSGDELDDLF